jgi:chemosensory pili system protein ChpB (putative protein-glutamate methylesterase)
MTSQDRPQIGVISDSALQRHNLSRALSGYGLSISVSGDPERLKDTFAEENPPVDCWILDLEDEDRWPDFLEELLDSTDIPILFGLGSAPERSSEEYPRWERRLFTKLAEELGHVELLDSEEMLTSLNNDYSSSHQPIPLPTALESAGQSDEIEQVWVLAASLGGPAAVKEFLDSLPKGLPVAFVYAQHIDACFADALTKVLARHSFLNLRKAEHGDTLKAGEVLMAPVDHEMIINEKGQLIFKNTPWPGPYGPSIDQTMLNVAQHYGSRCNVILFSGMGNDGAIAAPILKKQGCKIWVQQSESCANSSMPDSVAETGASSFTGTPTQLAARLVENLLNKVATPDHMLPD